MRDEHPWFCRVFPDLMEKLIDQEIDVGWVQAKRVRHGLRPWADEQIDGFYAQLYRPRLISSAVSGAISRSFGDDAHSTFAAAVISKP
jgi:hypothetical protein